MDLLVRVTFRDTHQEEAGDKIVLVPVAWKNIDEAFCVGEKINNIVRFSGEEVKNYFTFDIVLFVLIFKLLVFFLVVNQLPQDEVLCQFCYYADESKGILGLSHPFSLQHYSSERLIEFIDQHEYAVLLNMAEVSWTFNPSKSLILY